MKNKKFYGRFRWMIDACNNPRHADYHLYGAQGLQCHWQRNQYAEFEQWLLSTLGPPQPGQVLGRRDKSGDYAPGNLVWQSGLERARTKLRQNVYLEYQGQRLTLTEWSQRLGISYHRLRRGIQQRHQTINEIMEATHGKTQSN